MVTGELKRRIDALWTEFWQSGITNPLTVIEQITFLMYARLLDINEARDENREKRTGKLFARRFREDEQHLRWSQFRRLGAEKMLPLVRDDVFRHFRSTVASETAFAEFMKDAQLLIQKPAFFVKAVNMIHELPLTGERIADLLPRLANAVCEIPRGLLADAQVAVELHRRNPLEVRRHQVDRGEPCSIAERRALHHRPGLEREHAPLRAVAAPMRHGRMRDAALDIARAAVPAVRPIRPALRREPCLGRLVGRKHPEEPVQRQTLAI